MSESLRWGSNCDSDLACLVGTPLYVAILQRVLASIKRRESIVYKFVVNRLKLAINYDPLM